MDSQAIQLRPENAQGSDPTFAHIPYDQRWEPLKSTIVALYMEEREKIPRVSERMKNEYNEGGFDKRVDKKALKRYIGDQIRHEQPLQVDNTMFLRWHLPYAALLNSLGLPHDQSSPFGSSPQTPENITIESPGSDSPSGESPTTQIVRRKVHLDRAKLLLQGREMDLMRQLNKSEREATVTWLHDRWMYSFMTAKYWGKGPRYWTVQTIEFKTGTDKSLLEPATLSDSHGSGSTPSAQSLQPKSECHWTIHHQGDEYEALPDSPEDGPMREYDIEDESTWPAWTSSVDARTFNLLDDDDDDDDNDDDDDDDDNDDDDDLLDDYSEWEKVYNIYVEMEALHLAATYLDGSRQCCSLISELTVFSDAGEIDHFGHTVLDNIFLTILKSHTKVIPSATHIYPT
ncbi:hypothetical protein DL766_003194 [Monosporascus sp. MC13-8B]|uniref:Clr5 domain-containing protein n=1 Tax=Monosporascus cannonballus TaxID=155416 RepID=A0ABY0HFR3_9PEZI|nr:hypothetical protein DL762_002065 [Monosporascus cannonballus]RYO92168.1 hypothetical protein DL763_004783 [Monosporascus cannonballus]RYP34008.1 hypothetical protein DL766_003194 [Monosporascus sp. MC13-8B]